MSEQDNELDDDKQPLCPPDSFPVFASKLLGLGEPVEIQEDMLECLQWVTSTENIVSADMYMGLVKVYSPDDEIIATYDLAISLDKRTDV